MSFRICLRVKDKATRRTCIVYPTDDGVRVTLLTGEYRFVPEWKGGYSEYNDCGEAVLDSWIPSQMVTVHLNKNLYKGA